MFDSLMFSIHNTFNGVFEGLASSTLHNFNFCEEFVQLKLGLWRVSIDRQLHNSVHIAETWLIVELFVVSLPL